LLIADLGKIEGLGPAYAAQFNDASVVAAYGERPPYPDALIAWIVGCCGSAAPDVIDLGCGTGELTRRLAPRVRSVVAIDASPRMLDAARSLPGGTAPNITWIRGTVEESPVAPAFDAAVAAESFHWFDWPRACRRVRGWVPRAALLIVEGRFEVASAWADGLSSIIAEFSTNRAFQPYDLVAELESRGHIRVRERTSWRQSFEQSVDDYITSIHSRNGFSRDRMTDERAAAFDDATRRLVAPHSQNGTVTLTIETRAIECEVKLVSW
jgi:SAM-dependent methyltransferase